ncbi:hypothetical protein [Devosia alba]
MGHATVAFLGGLPDDRGREPASADRHAQIGGRGTGGIVDV